MVVNRAENTVQLTTQQGLAPGRCEEETSQRRRRNKSFDAAADYTIELNLSKEQMSTLKNMCKKNHDIDV